MTEDESEELINVASTSLGIRGLLTSDYRKHLIRDSDGHPYIIKILLGEVAKAKTLVKVERIVASKDKILDALFERTYASLSPAAKQVFLTMCNWRSTVPRIALEAVMLRPANENMDVEEAIDELIRCSFIEPILVPDLNESILAIPLAASVFGQKKLRASPMITAVQANTALLLNFGAGQKTDIKSGIGPRIEKFFRAVAEKASNDSSEIEAHLPMMEFLARRYSRGWLLLSRVYEESTLVNAAEKAKEYLRRYLEDVVDPEETRVVWSRLSHLCRSTEDWIGEIHAIVELCSLPGSSVREISDGLNRWNSLFKQQTLYMAGDERQILGRRLVQLFIQNSVPATATDMSRAAWLCMALREEDKAEQFVRQGLEEDSENEYCLNLAAKLKIQQDLIS
jgi:hypothetical protein